MIPPQVRFAVNIFGLEVGDYHRPDGFLVVNRSGAYLVKLEGWGSECVEGGLDEARQEAQRLAERWKSEGWSRVGVVTTDDSEVWFLTFAISSRLPKAAARDFEDEDVLIQ